MNCRRVLPTRATGPFSPGLGGVAVSLLVLRRELGAVHACLASLTSLLSAALGCASFWPAKADVLHAQHSHVQP